MKGVNKNVLLQAGLAAAFGAGFNSDWFKGQFEKLRREIDYGSLSPFVPWAVAAGVAYYVMKGKR